MTELLVTNLIYVAYRLLISGVLVKALNTRIGYYPAVVVAAQCSFWYDTLNFFFYFGAEELVLLNLLVANVLYTLRVIAAWFVIKRLWDWLDNYWLAVFFGAELTFIVDYFIIGSIAL